MLSAIIKRSLFLWVLALSACTIQLVPSYDEALVEGLNEANTKTLTLFAALEGPPATKKFDEFDEKYSEVIGSFEALHQRASNRQVPSLSKRLSKLPFVQQFCRSKGDPTACVNVTPASLAVVLTELRKLRDQHRDRGLAPDSIALARAAYDPAITNALFIENALKR